jgi:hypothetical protein
MAGTLGDQVTFEWAGQADEGGAPRAAAAPAAEPVSGQARTKPAWRARLGRSLPRRPQARPPGRLRAAPGPGWPGRR